METNLLFINDFVKAQKAEWALIHQKATKRLNTLQTEWGSFGFFEKIRKRHEFHHRMDFLKQMIRHIEETFLD